MTNSDKEILDPRTERLVGVSPDGLAVDNVTDQNRYDVSEKEPWVRVNLVTNDLKDVLHRVKMPNTRERPDVLLYNGLAYEVVETRTNPAIYRVPMTLVAEDLTPEDIQQEF